VYYVLINNLRSVSLEHWQAVTKSMIWYCSANNVAVKVFCDDKLQGNYSLLSKPYCNICSNPGVDTASCFHEDLYGFDRIYALGAYNKGYDDLLSTHIRYFKDNEAYSHPLGIALGILATNIYPELAFSNIIVPVPLHKEKLSERGFNQSLALCKVVRNRLNKPIVEALSKTRNIDMRLLSRNQRKDAVNGLYDLVENALPSLRDKDVLLVDDVITSGFTVSECAKVLKNAGAKSVNVLAAGRTPLLKNCNSAT
jgi:competence protein ComFC